MAACGEKKSVSSEYESKETALEGELLFLRSGFLCGFLGGLLGF
jgi:hypothetical protein